MIEVSATELQAGDVWNGQTIIAVDYCAMNYQPDKIRSIRVHTDDGKQHVFYPNATFWVERGVIIVNGKAQLTTGN